MTTQTDAILAHLQSGKSLTAMECLNLYGCLRLAARIKELRLQGYDIQTETITAGRKLYARYTLNKKTPDAYKVQGELLSA
jgi:hypothetical protein